MAKKNIVGGANSAFGGGDDEPESSSTPPSIFDMNPHLRPSGGAPMGWKPNSAELQQARERISELEARIADLEASAADAGQLAQLQDALAHYERLVHEAEAQMQLSIRDDGSTRLSPRWAVSSTGLHITAEIDEGEWETLLDGVEKIKSAYQWILGDWLLYGIERRYGQTEAQMRAYSERTRYSAQALYSFMQVARLFENSWRQEYLLSFEHYRIIASKYSGDSADEQAGRAYWVRRAADEKLSTRALQEAINEVKPSRASSGEALWQKWMGFEKQLIRAKKAPLEERRRMAAALRQAAADLERDE